MGTLFSKGFNKPYEISIITEVNHPSLSQMDLMVFPNPTSDYVRLIVGGTDMLNVFYELLDLNGRVLIKERIAGNETNILMNQFAAGTYFLKVSKDHQELKVFQLIKR
jgi:hypothetical protein